MSFRSWHMGRALLSCDDLSLSWRDAQHDRLNPDQGSVYNTLFALRAVRQVVWLQGALVLWYM